MYNAIIGTDDKPITTIILTEQKLREIQLKSGGSPRSLLPFHIGLEGAMQAARSAFP